MTTKSRASGFAGTNRRFSLTISWTPRTKPRAWVCWTQNEAGDEKEIELVFLDHTFNSKPETLGQVLDAALWALRSAHLAAPKDRSVS